MTSRCYKSDKKLVNSSSTLTTFTPGVDSLDTYIPRRVAAPTMNYRVYAPKQQHATTQHYIQYIQLTWLLCRYLDNDDQKPNN